MLRAATSLMLPVVVVGEFDYGLRQSRHYRRYAAWLDANLGNVEIVSLDREVAHAYGAVRLELTKAGEQINDRILEIGVVRRPPTEAEIARARGRASPEGKRLSWAEVVTKVRDGAPE